MKNIKYYILVILLIMGLNTYAQVQKNDSLYNYLEVAARNNPGVKSSFLVYKAFLEKIPQAGAFPDPQLDIGFFLKPMDIIDGKQIANFQLMQMFPWFGTRKAAQAEASHMAKMAFEQFRDSRDNLYLEVYTQWFTLCSLQQKLINNQENKKLLLQLQELALKKYSSPKRTPGVSTPSVIPTQSDLGAGLNTGGGMSGMSGGNLPAENPGSSGSMSSSMGGSSSAMGASSSGMSEVLRIQIEIAEIDNNIESTLSELNAEKIKFNTLLNRPTNNALDIPDSFEQINYIFDADTVINQIKNQNPMLGMITEEGLAYKAKAEMDKKMSYPMIGLGMQYMLIGKSTAMGMDNGMSSSSSMSDMNGKDMIMPMVTITLPIYRKKYNAQQREGKIWWKSNQEKYTNTLNQLEAELYKIKHYLDDSERKIKLYNKQTTLAYTTYNLAVKEFITNKGSLANVLEIQRQLLDYKLKKTDAIADYNTKVASIQRLISSKNED